MVSGYTKHKLAALALSTALVLVLGNAVLPLYAGATEADIVAAGEEETLLPEETPETEEGHPPEELHEEDAGEEADSTQEVPWEGPAPEEPGEVFSGEDDPVEQAFADAEEAYVPPREAYYRPVIEYDPQPQSLEDVMAALANLERPPRYEHPVEEAFLPEGFVNRLIELGGGLQYYSVEYQPREAETRAVGTAAALREAFADLVDGDVIVLTASIELGTLAPGDGQAASLTIPSGTHITLTADENGPHTLYRRDNLRHFQLVDVEESTLTLRDVALQGLRSPGAEPTRGLVRGGGIELTGCRDVTIEGAEILAAGHPTGGALEIRDSEGVRLAEPNLKENAAQQGGALAVFDSEVLLEGGSLAANNAERGGGVYAQNSSLTLAAEVEVKANTAEWGGGLYLLAGTCVAEQGASLVGNTASTRAVNASAQGGGARLESGAQLLLRGGAQVADNQALAEWGNGLGGGVAACSGSTLVVESASITNNQAAATHGQGYGGGVYLGAGSEGSRIEDGGQVAQNRADAGGGVYLNDGSTLVLGGDLAQNHATSGGGAACLFTGAALTLEDSARLEDNSAPEGAAVFLYEDAALQASDITVPPGLAAGAYGGAGSEPPDAAEPSKPVGGQAQQADPAPAVNDAAGQGVNAPLAPERLAATPIDLLAPRVAWTPTGFALALAGLVLAALQYLHLRTLAGREGAFGPGGPGRWPSLAGMVLGLVGLGVFLFSGFEGLQGPWLATQGGILACQLLAVAGARFAARRAEG